MSNKTKLELTWIGKDEEIKAEPRILLYDKEKSYGDEETENMLIHGDNLLALKSLEQDYKGQIKCIYIDPPYNTGSAFEHYDDNLEHSIWLGLIKVRLEVLKNLLAEDGSIWISIDDDEGHYLKVLCDEVFGRSNFIASCIWHKKHTRSNDAKWFSDNHDYILVYSNNREIWRPNLLPRTQESLKGYTNPDNDSRGVWASGPCHVKTPNPKDIYPITTPGGKVYMPPSGTSWRFSKEKIELLISENRIWFGVDGNNVPRFKRFLSDVKDGFVPLTLWFRDEVGDNQEAKKEVKVFNSESVFSTPKPERLIERILTLATNEGDLVLDSFLGSGTTAAVAHKMGRKYIGIELGDHCYTHCKVRLDKVIDSEQGGISKSINWTGGGGYKFYELAPSLIKKDNRGNMVIDEDKYNANMLAAAIAKLHGFDYSPDDTVFWKQGVIGKKSFIFTTTAFLDAKQLNNIIKELDETEQLLICCSAFELGIANDLDNLLIKKIPKSVLNKCEYGKDNYNLNIINTTEVEEDCEEWEDV